MAAVIPRCAAVALTAAAVAALPPPPLQARSPSRRQQRHDTAAHRRRFMATLASASASTSIEQQAGAELQQHEPLQQLPATYRRLVARRTGGSFREVAEVQEGVPMPELQEGEVLVRVHYAGE